MAIRVINSGAFEFKIKFETLHNASRSEIYVVRVFGFHLYETGKLLP